MVLFLFMQIILVNPINQIFIRTDNTFGCMCNRRGYDQLSRRFKIHFDILSFDEQDRRKL